MKLIQIPRAARNTPESSMDVILYQVLSYDYLTTPNASLNETDAAIAQKTTSSDQNDVILQFYQIHGVISTPSMELESNSNKYDTLEACADRRGKIGHV